MRKIRLSAIAHSAICRAGAATSPTDITGEQQPDGTWIIPISDETMDIIVNQARPGENISDTIVRVLRRINV